MKTIYNLDQVVNIYISDKYLNRSYEYKKFKKRLFLKNIEEGFYTFNNNKKANIEYLNKQYIILGSDVWYKPSVELTFSNNEVHIEYFDTYEEAIQYGNDITNKNFSAKLEVEK